jgi:outer membrane protein assembly factor BamB
MIKNKSVLFFLFFFLISNCSFDNKTGIWDGSEEERQKIADLENRQKEVIDTDTLLSSDEIYTKEVILSEKIILSKPIKNSSWEMSNLNYQNSLGNLYLSGSDFKFLKKRAGKNKSSVFKISTSPLFFNNHIIMSNDRGTIFKINDLGDIIWKKNIYQNVYKKIFKSLHYSIYENNIYVSDNIGFVYSLSLNNGNLIWIKNHGIPLKSEIKVFKDKIFLIDQDNRFVCFSIKDGSKIWDIRAIPSFIKLQNPLSIALTYFDHFVAINSSGDLFKGDSNSGQLFWSFNSSGSLYAHSTDFLKSSRIVIDNKENIIFSANLSLFSYNLNSGYANWTNNVSTTGTPIISNKNIFFVTENGFFVIMKKDTGKIIFSTNILKILKERKQSTKVVGFIMGSGKMYSVTANGYLIVNSATTGKTKTFKKIGDPIASSPIIADGKIYILTANSKILGFK